LTKRNQSENGRAEIEWGVKFSEVISDPTGRVKKQDP